MADKVKRGMRFGLDVASADGLRGVFEEVVGLLERTDEMYPIDWSTLQIQSAEGGFRVSVMTEEPPPAEGVMPVEPLVQLHPGPATGPFGGGVMNVRGEARHTAAQINPPETITVGFPDTMGYIQ